MNNQKEDSKKNWTSDSTVDHINSGCFQRIADATEKMASSAEKMASSYDSIRANRDHYKEMAERRWNSIKKLERSNASLRGVITKLKKVK